MEKDCCNMKVTEIDDGIKIEITGKDIKDKCKVMMKNCCTDEKICEEVIEKCCHEKKK